MWTGGYYYLLNLLRAIDLKRGDGVRSVLFVPPNTPANLLNPFAEIANVEIVRDEHFDARFDRRRLIDALILGSDHGAAKCFRAYSVDVVFEAARYYGWRFPFPLVTWLADFQHRRMPEFFGKAAYWRRELGFQVQVRSRGRQIMVSSYDAKADCEIFYPFTLGRVAVVSFAVPVELQSALEGVSAVRAKYGLPPHFFFLPNQFWKHKNHELVIAAVEILKRRGVDCVVAASGQPVDPRRPTHFDDLKRRVDDSGLRSSFRFLGMIPRVDLLGLMRACSALINPSKFEGWSTTVEEAKSLGVPMLLSELAVHREQAGDRARFFSSPVELAELLVQSGERSDAQRNEAERAALQDCKNRTDQFAADFLNIVGKSLA